LLVVQLSKIPAKKQVRKLFLFSEKAISFGVYCALPQTQKKGVLVSALPVDALAQNGFLA
jgi:hypothetical protein